MNPTVLVIGSMNMDFSTISETLPAVGETVLAHDFKMSPGGKGANQAVAASRLGADVYLIGQVGKDVIGKRIIENLKQQGVGTKGIQETSEAHSGIALIMVNESGENIITVASGTNLNVNEKNIVDNRDLLEQADVVLLQLEIPLETVAYAAKQSTHAKIILNPAPAKELPKELLKHVDVLTPNEKEAETLTGVEVDSVKTAKEAGMKILEHDVKAVVITLGDQGAVAVTQNDTFHINAPNVNTVDTTGAGDAFCGALARYLEEKNFQKAVQLAVVAGTLATTKIGAQKALPTEQEIDTFLRHT